jgi:hypothetical protein
MFYPRATTHLVGDRQPTLTMARLLPPIRPTAWIATDPATDHDLTDGGTRPTADP